MHLCITTCPYEGTRTVVQCTVLPARSQGTSTILSGQGDAMSNLSVMAYGRLAEELGRSEAGHLMNEGPKKQLKDSASSMYSYFYGNSTRTHGASDHAREQRHQR